MKNILLEILKSPQFTESVAWNRRVFMANDVVVKQGELGKTLFLIEEGILRVTGNVELDEQKHIQPGFCDLDKGSLFGEVCLHESTPRIATVVAVTDCRLVEIDGYRLSIFLDAHPAIGYLFYKNMFASFVGRLNIANQRVEKLMAWGLKVHEIDKYL